MTVYVNGVPNPDAELTGDAVIGDVKDGKFFYKDDPEVKLEGTIPTVTLAVDSDTYPTGYHAGDAGGLDAIDADFATANIKKDVVIFGKTGTHVTPITGDADVAEVKDGKFFYKDDAEVKLEGTMPTVTLAVDSDTYPEGYHAGDVGGLDAIDADFATANIKKGTVIFGKTGTYVTAITGDAVVGDVKDGVFFYKDDAETKLEGTLALTGDAVVADVKDGMFFYKDDAETQLEGTMPTVAIVAASDAYPAGYHVGNVGGLDAIDPDLAVGNIKLGTTIFGKVGTLPWMADNLEAGWVYSEVDTSNRYSDGGNVVDWFTEGVASRKIIVAAGNTVQPSWVMVTKSLDLTGINIMLIDIKIDASEVDTEANINVKVDGDIKWTKSFRTVNAQAWLKQEIDVSAYSGSKVINLGIFSYGLNNTAGAVWFDNIVFWT